MNVFLNVVACNDWYICRNWSKSMKVCLYQFIALQIVIYHSLVSGLL